jgi:hypothetical protein
MKGAFDEARLRSEILAHRPMDVPTERRVDFLIGDVSLHKRLPNFSYGWGGTLAQGAAFRRVEFSYPEVPVSGIALILRGFVHASGEPEEFFAGWVRHDQERDLEHWMSFFNAQIALRLAGAPYDPDQHGRWPATGPSVPAHAGADTVPDPARPESTGYGRHDTSLRAVRKQGLIPVGFFRELGNDEADAPSIAEARGKRAPDHKAEVVAYLRGADVLLTWMSADGAEDYFAPGEELGPEHVLTDGVFAWPSTLALYVDQYDVALPTAFEEHMAAHHWLSAPARQSMTAVD